LHGWQHKISKLLNDRRADAASLMVRRDRDACAAMQGACAAMAWLLLLSVPEAG
jgi:hypothetical protein